MIWPLIAIGLALLAVGYAFWPVRHANRPARSIDASAPDLPESVERAAAVVRAWSHAAGEWEAYREPKGELRE